jgi:hypothetical protein
MNSSESCLEAPRRAPWSKSYAETMAAIGNFYCSVFHRSISRPVNGTYRCWSCLREFDLRW